VEVTNALAYCITVLVNTVESFMVQRNVVF
jgi:hypothetical protein